MSAFEIGIMGIVWKLLSGVFIRACVGFLLILVKRCDKEHGLPEKLSGIETLLMIFTGVLVSGISVVEVLLHFIIVVYLCFTAYTDHHTKMVYSSGAYIVGAIGFVTLIRWNCTVWPVILVFYGLIVLLTLCKGMSWGDTEIFIATAPYLAMKTETPIQTLWIFFLLSEAFFLVYAFLLCKAKTRDFCAMAPAIALAAFILF